MVFMNELEWPMLSYYVIYYDKFRNVMHQTEKEAFFNIWASVACPIEKGILKDCEKKCVFWHKMVIPKYHPLF